MADTTPEKALPGALAGHLPERGPDRVLALGKAARALARSAHRAWPGAEGLLYEVPAPGPAPPGWRVLQGSHPLSEAANGRATEEVRRWLDGGEGFLLALVSGGASALLADPWPPWTPPHEARLCADLLASGAPIADVNAVRMRLSRSRGGGLRRLWRGPVVTGVWCDVAERAFRLVGSAPTVAVRPTFRAEEVLERLGVRPPLPLPEDRILRRAPAGDRCVLLASGERLARLAARALVEESYRARALPLAEGTDAGLLAARIRRLAESTGRGRRAWVLSGEASTFGGGGRGGRCSHLAALVALELSASGGWTFVALATDGADGSGDGGAWVGADSLPPGEELRAAVAGGDTARLWAAHGNALPRRPTGNNLRDLYVMAVDR